ncbi:hypothetical protein ATANTOWER_032155 [Ataeniobius toweri]|uniref:Uncharacterized protein n=1 Tax=Ataeniobius toweri TaxID=208326 RepID=A0ABU7BWM2_9TELE|nr:hypothetical protein [Ataeniobius toweri]
MEMESVCCKYGESNIQMPRLETRLADEMSSSGAPRSVSGSAIAINARVCERRAAGAPRQKNLSSGRDEIRVLTC